MLYMNTDRKKGLKHNNNKGNRAGASINTGIIFLIVLMLIFFVRLAGVLSSNKERGGFAYVQLLNLGMPIIQSQIYDEGNYVENNLSLKYVLLETLGVNDISYTGIIKSELSFFNIPNNVTNKNDVFTFNPFQIKDDSISKTTVTDNIQNTKIYDPSLKKDIDQSKPEVLIYHTHTQENYSDVTPDSTDENTNVVGVGDVLAKELEENYGISVIHDKTNHSVSYNNSYARSGETVDKYLQKYGDFKMIIDLHRDSVQDKALITTEIEGMSASKVMFVNAKNSTRYEKNKELTEKVFNKTAELFPTLVRGIHTYDRGKGAFNQSKSDGSLLFEIGSNNNTPDESKVAAQCMARVIAEILNK